jgi:CysZ protein
MLSPLSPLARAIGQLDDRAFLGVLWRSLAWSAACFVALHIAAVWVVERELRLHGWLDWGAGFLASLGATVLTSWLFLPLAAVIGMLYIDRIAAAVERRWYPSLPPARPAPITQQVLDGLSLGLRVLLLNLLALLLAVTWIGLPLGWLIAGYAVGRGLFMAVAMRRMPRDAAYQAYRYVRLIVLVYGALMALAAYLPLLNLFIPLIGTAAMVHILDLALTQSR